jgi:predicted nuclease of predicted toxin-antitoxin system
VKFKIDESLPAEAAQILRDSGFVADTVADEDLSGSDDEVVATRSRSEDRVLVTLDLDFANIRAYPPGEHSGIIVLRVKRQDKATVLTYVRRLATALANRKPGLRGIVWVKNADFEPETPLPIRPGKGPDRN